MQQYQSEFISIRPISVNSCYQGRRFRTSIFKKWQKDVLLLLPKLNNKITDKDLGIRLWFYLKHPTKIDGDNLIKSVLDCCVKRGIIKDDRYFNYYEIFKKQAKKEEGFEIEIFTLK